MKTKLALIIVVLALVVHACKNPQTAALNTLSSLELTTTAAYDGYVSLVVKGNVPTNDVPKVSKIYNDFQAGMVVAIVALQGNTNALAPDSLIQESAAVVQLINTIERK